MNANKKNSVEAPAPATLKLAFDVGSSSLGWAVLDTSGDAEIKGCGVVIFRANDCLASARRAYRRQRRHIRSTRQRIARLKTLLESLGVLARQDLDRPGCAWPWQLAARVLRGGKLLTWPELWDVLRWYAHNRGYDGNRRWSAGDADACAEDTEKEENAKSLMERHGVHTMCETVCLELKVDPLGAKRASTVWFRGLNAAFPRGTVEAEVRRIIRAHFNALPRVNPDLERALLGTGPGDKSAWKAIRCDPIKVPKRYEGGLLFGQLVPRFDNRIIARCPISGEKVPSRNCREFLDFRWGMQLANVRVARAAGREMTPLTAAERQQVHATMRQQGAMGVEEFKKSVRTAAGALRDNLDELLMHPDAKEALVLDPVQKLIQAPGVRTLWPLLPSRIQKRARGQLHRGKTVTLGRLRAQAQEIGADLAAFDAELDRLGGLAGGKARPGGGGSPKNDLLDKALAARGLAQRAAFARPLLSRAFEEVMQGRHPKEAGGCLFMSEAVRAAQLARGTADQTNNHLVRHRLLMLERLFGDVVREYCGGDKARIGAITIEVNRDLREMSGLTAEEKASEMGRRLANHRSVSERLENDASLKAVLQQGGTRITAGLIRKARVADDLGWTCPYTGQKFEPVDLVTKRVDKDHIIPRSERASDALDSLVITFSAINKWKGKRTALRFIEDEQGKPVPALPNLSIMSVTRYRQLVGGLESSGGHEDDKRRKRKRKELLLLPAYEEKSFTPRDLTTTSQLVRLGAAALRKALPPGVGQVPVISLPGSVTGAVRKAWRVLGCLGLAAPRVLDESGETRTKDEVRDITHLHHALDACVLGLASHYLPNHGRVWELLVKRKWTPAEQEELTALGLFLRDSEGRFQMRDLSPGLKEQIRQRLAERRVVQHVPARMDGLRAEQNAWRVVSVAGDTATLRQRVRAADGSRPPKETQEKVVKLLGVAPSGAPGKLKTNKAALVVPDNFGVALTTPNPVVVPFHKVWPRLAELRLASGGRMPRVLRNGQLIRVPGTGRFSGVWRVFSAKNNAGGIALDIGLPDAVKLKNKTEGHKINVRLASLLKEGMEVLRTPLTGANTCPTTSSTSTRRSAR